MLDPKFKITLKRKHCSPVGLGGVSLGKVRLPLAKVKAWSCGLRVCLQWCAREERTKRSTSRSPFGHAGAARTQTFAREALGHVSLSIARTWESVFVG